MEDPKTIAIKGMVCDRCIKVLTRAFQDMGLKVKSIHLGTATLVGTAQLSSMELIQQTVNKYGFELLSDRNTQVILVTKRVIDAVLEQKYDTRMKFSELISEELHMDYGSISTIFLTVEGLTLEKYMINRRLDKVKELLIYTKFTLTEIAHLTGFSSIQHLSHQFKVLTGFSPSDFRTMKA